MKRCFLITAACLYLFSCKKKDISPNTKNSPLLQFENIQYVIEKGDGISADTVAYLPLTCSNSTTVQQMVVFHPDIKQTSLFKSDSILLQNIIRDSLKVNVPLTISSSGSIVLNPQSVLLCDSLISLASPVVETDSLFVKPNTSLSFNAKLITSVLTATYYIKFIEPVSGIERIMRGKWTGTIPLKVEHEVSVNNIK